MAVDDPTIFRTTVSRNSSSIAEALSEDNAKFLQKMAVTRI